MKRNDLTACSVQQSDEHLGYHVKRRRDDESSASYESPTHLEGSDSQAADSTRSDSYDPYVSPFSAEASRSSAEYGPLGPVREEDAAETSPFLHAMSELETQITEKQDQLREIEWSTRKLYKDEVTRLCREVQRLTSQNKQMVAEKHILLNEKKTVETELAQERSNLSEEKKRVVMRTNEINEHLTIIVQLRQQNEQVDAELSALRTEHSDHLEKFKSTQARFEAELSASEEALARKKQATSFVEAGYAMLKKKDFPAAYDLFDAAVTLDAETMLPHYHKASGYFQQGDYKGCVETCRQAMAADRGSCADKRIVAALYKLAAVASVQRADACQVDVQHDEVNHERISCLEHAVQFYGQSLSNCPDAEVAKKHTRYVELLRQAYINPRLSQDALERGNAFCKTGDYVKAAVEYDEAVKRNPGNARLYLTRAWCHMKQKRSADAIHDCRRALEVDPNYAAAYTKMGTAQRALGQCLHAELSYKKALELDPAESEAERALKELQNATKK